MFVLQSLAAALCLTICASLKTFLTLFILCLLHRLGWNIPLFDTPYTNMLFSDAGLLCLGMASIIEIIDNLSPIPYLPVGIVMLIMRPLAAVFCCLSVVTSDHMATRFTISLLISVAVGGPLLVMRRRYLNYSMLNPTIYATTSSQRTAQASYSAKSGFKKSSPLSYEISEDVIVIAAVILSSVFPVPVAILLLGAIIALISRGIMQSRPKDELHEHKFLQVERASSVPGTVSSPQRSSSQQYYNGAFSDGAPPQVKSSRRL